MIALLSNNLNKLKKEFLILLGLFVLFVIVFKIVFFRDSFMVVLKMVFGLFWLFVFPGFMLMYYWDDKLRFLERFVIGTGLGMAINGLLSYHLGLIGINIKYHIFIITPLMLVVGVVVFFKKKTQ